LPHVSRGLAVDARSIELVTGGKTDLAALTTHSAIADSCRKISWKCTATSRSGAGFSTSTHSPGRIRCGPSLPATRSNRFVSFDPLSQRSIRGLQRASILPDLLAAETATGQRNASLLDYADDRAIVVIDEPESVDAAVRERPPAGMDEMLTAERVNEILSLFPCITLRTIAAQTQAIDFGSRPQPSFNGSIAALRRDLAQLQDGAYSVTLACDSDSERVRCRNSSFDS